MDGSYDDWGAVINISNSNFNTQPDKYNGDPITIVSATEFAVHSVGSSMPATAVTGTAEIKTGWGGPNIAYHTWSG